jgi:hypothetical protein
MVSCGRDSRALRRCVAAAFFWSVSVSLATLWSRALLSHDTHSLHLLTMSDDGKP